MRADEGWSSAASTLFSRDVSCVVTTTLCDVDALHADERALAQGAIPRRQRELATGRWAARAALARLGVAPAAIPRGPDGAPSWPAGLAGTIAHTDGLVGAAVCSTAARASIGLDVERLEPREHDRDLVRRLCDAAERALLDTLDPAVRVRVAFSCKESFYKCVQPVLGAPFVLPDIRLVAIDPVASVVTLRFGALAPLRCRYLLRPPYILAATELGRLDHGQVGSG